MPTRREALAATLGLTGSAFAARAAQEPAVAPAPSRRPPVAKAAAVAPVCLADFEPVAKQRISAMAYEYIAGGAGDELTLRANRDAYDIIRLRTRVLVDVSRLDTSITLLGEKHACPILLAPTAYHQLAHPEGELATARGADTAGVTMILSSFSTTPVEDVARTAPARLWFQLYTQKDRGFTKDLMQRAEAAGCRALCVTVDTPVLGARNRETRVGFTLPKGMERVHLKTMGVVAGGAHRPREREIYSEVLDPTLTWKDIEWLVSVARTPVLLKGILSADDADHAAKSGAAGIVVSNHGARNLDTVPATIEALPEIADRLGGRMPILVDGGIRRGTDVLKALALGASAVLIGRPVSLRPRRQRRPGGHTRGRDPPDRVRDGHGTLRPHVDCRNRSKRSLGTGSKAGQRLKAKD